MSVIVINIIIIITVVITAVQKVAPEKMNQYLKSIRKSIADLLDLASFDHYPDCIF